MSRRKKKTPTDFDFTPKGSPRCSICRTAYRAQDSYCTPSGGPTLLVQIAGLQLSAKNCCQRCRGRLIDHLIDDLGLLAETSIPPDQQTPWQKEILHDQANLGAFITEEDL